MNMIIIYVILVKKENQKLHYYIRCVEECDNKTYYKSALKENYCVHCKDEGTYLYEEENKCVLDCNDRKRKL